MARAAPAAMPSAKTTTHMTTFAGRLVTGQSSPNSFAIRQHSTPAAEGAWAGSYALPSGTTTLARTCRAISSLRFCITLRSVRARSSRPIRFTGFHATPGQSSDVICTPTTRNPCFLSSAANSAAVISVMKISFRQCGQPRNGLILQVSCPGAKAPSPQKKEPGQRPGRTLSRASRGCGAGIQTNAANASCRFAKASSPNPISVSSSAMNLGFAASPAVVVG
jgi:hypothetical protein